LLRKDFDLLRSARPTVPLYADGHALLVFRPFWQSASVSKISFSTRSEKRAFLGAFFLFQIFLAKPDFHAIILLFELTVITRFNNRSKAALRKSIWICNHRYCTAYFPGLCPGRRPQKVDAG
ncbi:MAG: hypothetical protein IKH07_08130, partial [Oscillospiraceae bacterium]|nr:hypothetical protein [Oscillospiraceae bacterium]